METIKEELAPEVYEIIEKWKNKQGNLIMILHAIQGHYGYIPRNIAMFLSEQLSIPLARIYEVITFYNFFNLEPPADFTISICTGTACHLKGAPTILESFKKKLNIKVSENYSIDRKYKVEEVRCIGCCGLAPAIMVNGEVIGKVKPEQVEEIIKKYQ